MKHNTLFIALVLISFFTLSCDSDDEKNASLSPFAGQWEAISFETKSESVIFNGYEDLKSIITTTGKNINYVLTFDESTYTAEGNYTMELDYMLNGVNVDFEDISFDAVMTEGEYTYTDSTLTIMGVLFTIDEQMIEPIQESNTLDFTIIENELVINSYIQTVQNGAQIKTRSESVWIRK